MSKNKNSSNLEREKALAKLIQKDENGDFENVDQVIGFIRRMKGKNSVDLPDLTTHKGRSQDLVFEAYEQTAAKDIEIL